MIYLLTATSCTAPLCTTKCCEGRHSYIPYTPHEADEPASQLARHDILEYLLCPFFVGKSAHFVDVALRGGQLHSDLLQLLEVEVRRVLGQAKGAQLHG